MGSMGPIKSFLELSESMLKLRENFDSVILGKKALHGSGKQIEEEQPDFMNSDLLDCDMIKKSSLNNQSPLKKKDLMNEFGRRASDELEGGYILGSA